jgi:PAS domain S-box-containing protein
LPVIFWTADAQGNIDYLNQKWVEFTGRPLEETLGSGWRGVVHPDDEARTLNSWRAAVLTGGNYDLSIRCRNAAGQYRWLQVRASPARDEAGRITKWYGTANDIHDQRLAEEALRRARAEAEAASRAKDQFLAALSHELRTPLNPALLVLSSLSENPALPEHLRDEVLTAKRNIEIETHLIDDLLDVTRITQGKMHVRRETVALHEILRHAWNACVTAGARREIELKWDLRAERQHVAGDPARLQQVFWNLLKNALKFTPEGGTITISTENVTPEQVRITIRDTGIGIARDALRRIFAPFDQGSPTIAKVFGGLGLGLAIARGVVDVHGGTITASSDGVGKGAAFTIELKTVAPPAPSHPRDRSRGQPAANPLAAGSVPRQLLLVEDHDDTARTMTRILKIQGHTVTAARTKAEAIDCVNRLPFDAVITDLGLPDGSGRDLIRQLRAMHPRLPVIALSGYGMPEDIEESMQAGAVAHITKPIDLNRLRDTLDRINRELV